MKERTTSVTPASENYKAVTKELMLIPGIGKRLPMTYGILGFEV
ncbi:MAG: hypothetical protein R2741_10740 [Methanolobus sp.]